MSDEKKDLTRIEDLGEFLHQLNEPDNYLPELPEEASLDSLPDLPAEEPFDLPDVPSEDTPEEDIPHFELPSSDDDPFGSVEESSEASVDESSEFSTSDFGSTDFASTDFGSTDFETSDFESSDFGATDFESAESEAEVEPESEATLPESSPFELSVDEISEQQAAEPEYESNEETSNDSSFQEDSPMQEDLDSFEEKESASTQAPEVYTPKETFQDTKSFTDNAVLSDIAAECNPPFSVIARNIRYLEDSEDILSLLKEVGFPEDMQDQFKRQIERGTLLVPRISEFAAIYICHKLRHLKIDLTMGLSEILHPPKNQTDLDRGLVSKRSLTQNQSHKFDFKNDIADAKQIILSTLPHLEGHSIEKYLGMATEHSFLDSHLVENEASNFIHQSYDELAQKLKGHALEHKANAVLGINYQLTPMPSDQGMGQFRYKLTCTGNLVYLYKLNTHA